MSEWKLPHTYGYNVGLLRTWRFIPAVMRHSCSIIQRLLNLLITWKWCHTSTRWIVFSSDTFLPHENLYQIPIMADYFIRWWWRWFHIISSIFESPLIDIITSKAEYFRYDLMTPNELPSTIVSICCSLKWAGLIISIDATCSTEFHTTKLYHITRVWWNDWN